MSLISDNFAIQISLNPEYFAMFVSKYFAMQISLITEYFAMQMSFILEYFALQLSPIHLYFAMQMSLIPEYLASSVFVNLKVIKLLHIVTLVTFYLTTVSVIVYLTSVCYILRDWIYNITSQCRLVKPCLSQNYHRKMTHLTSNGVSTEFYESNVHVDIL